mgnify:CR=1 FL=1
MSAIDKVNAERANNRGLMLSALSEPQARLRLVFLPQLLQVNAFSKLENRKEHSNTRLRVGRYGFCP